jgi:hypothetical protein
VFDMPPCKMYSLLETIAPAHYAPQSQPTANWNTEN